MTSIRNKSLQAVALSWILAIFTGCGMIYDDLEPCTQSYRIAFVYDYNLLWADAFAHEVKAVDVWAYDADGNFVWKGQAQGDDLSREGFSIDAPLAPGEYSFLCWGGLVSGTQYSLSSSSNSDITALGMNLSTETIDGAAVSRADIKPLFHGLSQNVTLGKAAGDHLVQTVVIPLVKDTKSITFMLQNTDGSSLDKSGFEVSITSANSSLAYNNNFLPSPVVEYRPWDITEASVGKMRAMTSVSTLIFSLSTNRLYPGSDTRLRVKRLSDGVEIIDIPLVDYLLLVKDKKSGSLTDQQYLDRCSDYSLLFFLDDNSNWTLTNGVIINSWAVVPPQVF